jgi:hypothetical protein
MPPPPPSYIGIVYPQPVVEELIVIALEFHSDHRIPIPMTLHWVMQIEHAIALRGWPAGHDIPHEALNLNQVGRYMSAHNVIAANRYFHGSTWAAVLFRLTPSEQGDRWVLTIAGASFHSDSEPEFHANQRLIPHHLCGMLLSLVRNGEAAGAGA